MNTIDLTDYLLAGAVALVVLSIILVATSLVMMMQARAYLRAARRRKPLLYSSLQREREQWEGRPRQERI